MILFELQPKENVLHPHDPLQKCSIWLIIKSLSPGRGI